MKGKLRKAWLIPAILLLLLTLGVVWYHVPARIAYAEAEDVASIKLFSGTTGNSVVIEDQETIAAIMEDFRSVRLQRGDISAGRMGYSLQVTIQYQGMEFLSWESFIVNSSEVVRKDPFFYDIPEGQIDFEYLCSLVDASEN